MDRRNFIKSVGLAGLAFLTPVGRIDLESFEYQPKLYSIDMFVDVTITLTKYDNKVIDLKPCGAEDFIINYDSEPIEINV